MEASYTSNPIHTGCWWLCYLICQQMRWKTSNECLQSRNWLDWWTILWKHLPRSTETDMSMSICQDSSRSNPKNIITLKKDHLKTAHTPLLPSPRSPPRRHYQRIIQELEKRVQQVVGRILYYAQTVDIMLHMTLNTIATGQSKAT